MIKLNNLYFLCLNLRGQARPIYKVDNSGISFDVDQEFTRSRNIKLLFNDSLELKYVKCFNSTEAITDHFGAGTYNNVGDVLREQLCPSDDLINGSDIKDKKLYRTPKLDLPQIKVDNIKAKYNVKIKRNIKDADYIVTSKKYIENMYDYAWNKVFPIQDFIEDVITSHEECFTVDAYHNILNVLRSIESEDPSAYIRLKLHSDYQSLDDNLSKVLSVDRYNSIYKGTNVLENSLQPYLIKDYEAYKNLWANKHIVVSDVNISKICNEDSVILSIEDSKNIATMVKSGDKENLALGLEMLANCNAEESYDKIALIFAFYLDHLKAASNWNHVNVKSLRSIMKDIPYIDEYSQHVSGYERLTKRLVENDKLTRFAIGAIKNKIFKTVIKRTGLNCESGIFEFSIKDLKLKKEFVPCDDLPF